VSVRVEIYSSEETIKIFTEADFEALLEEHRRFAIRNIHRYRFNEATGAAADVSHSQITECSIPL